MLNTLEIFQQGRALLAEPARWTTGRNARDENGYEVSPINPTACSWCTFGALFKLDDLSYPSEAVEHLERAQKELHPEFNGPLSAFNDKHSHSEVLAVWDKAISYVTP